jgi:hypothetical protein
MSGSFGRWAARLGTVIAAATLAACGGGGGGEAASADGTLRVAMTDAPACGYDNVFVTVEKVRVHASAAAGDAEGGWHEVVVSPARRVDLLTLTNGVLEELGQTALPAGQYSQVRLVLAANSGSAPTANAVKPTGGTLTPLDTPSAQQSGLKLQAHFDVQSGQMADLVIDFDACKSVVKAGNSGKYNLKPVISVTPRLATSVSGFVTSTLTMSSTTVSIQQNGTVVRSTTPDASGRFNLAFVTPGTYDLVIVSEGRATGVITSIPVTTATGSVTLGGTSTAIVLPVSSMSDVTGTASVSTGTGTATVTTPVTDATVTAQQALTGGPTITVASTNVDATLGSYSLRLPRAAPVKAAYGTTLTFAADTAVAGKYTLRGTAPGKAAASVPIDVTAGNVTQNIPFAP